MSIDRMRLAADLSPMVK